MIFPTQDPPAEHVEEEKDLWEESYKEHKDSKPHGKWIKFNCLHRPRGLDGKFNGIQ